MIKQPPQGSSISARPRLAVQRRSSVSRASHGQVMVMFALMLTAMIGMLALVFDIGYGLIQRRISQNIADSTAMAGAQTIGNNSPPYVKILDSDVYNIVLDVVIGNNIAASRVTITNPVGVGTTPGQAYLVAQYVDATGIPIAASYVTGTALPIPPTAMGIKVDVKMRYTTFFASAIGFTNVNVSGGSAAVARHVTVQGLIGVQAFAARWHPPFGAAGASTVANQSAPNRNPNPGCASPVPFNQYQCYTSPLGQNNSYPNASLIPNGTSFVLWDNGGTWQNVNAGPAGSDLDWAGGSSSFKGFFNNLATTCVYNNYGSGVGASVGQVPTNPYGVAVFPLVDYSYGNGNNFAIHVYGFIALQITQNGTSLTGVKVYGDSTLPVDPGCGQTVIDTTGQSQFLSAFLIS